VQGRLLCPVCIPSRRTAVSHPNANFTRNRGVPFTGLAPPVQLKLDLPGTNIIKMPTETLL
jgi:hypothetical protein